MPPFIILAISMALLLGLILWLRLNAFLALVASALVVSLLAPGGEGTEVARVAEALGASAGKLCIPIAMAALVGNCLLASGAAERIVRAMLSLFGEKRGATALAAGGFVLSIPVFFDTVFFLLVPLCRSLFQRTQRNYLKYLLAIGVGGAIAHTLVPPTPGPLLVANQLGVDVGLMMLAGIAVGLPSLGIGLLVAGWIDRWVPLENLPQLEESVPERDASSDIASVNSTVNTPVEEIDDTATCSPGLFVSALPILLPVFLVASQTILEQLAARLPSNAQLMFLGGFAQRLGDPNLALSIAAAVALVIYLNGKRPSLAERKELVEQSLMSAGVIVMITAAGGAFGAMLKVAQIGPAIEATFATATASGTLLLWLAFGIASLMKVSQGSSTVAMITASAMIAAMVEGRTLGYHPVYLAQAIGCGSLFGVWMNDSGFWLFCRMGGLSEREALKTWSVILAVIAMTAMLTTVLLANLFPLVADHV